MPGQYTGAALHRYYVDVAALPGTVTQARHADDAGGGEVERDKASQGGSWAPAEWLSGADPVLTGGLIGEPDDHHVASGSHAGANGAGMGRWVGQDPDRAARRPDPPNVPATLETAGASGAAFGGLVKTGSMEPEANPGGVDLGETYNRPVDAHRQRLHFNRPGLRLIRTTRPTAEVYQRHAEAGGPSKPRLRRLLAPAGQRDFVPVDQAPAVDVADEHGTIGGGWAL